MQERPTNESASLSELVSVASAIRQQVEKVVEGKPEAARLALTVLLAQGHLLVEDVPGVGKTMLAKTLARALDCSVRRIQFTPDLLPGDVTGVSVFDQERRDFEFRPGAIFANIVIGDEINRASPKTQAALLECMEERQVTADGVTYPLAEPFMVVATQNPVEMEGTYPLPEAQRDRFMARVAMGYPDRDAEIRMLDSHASDSPLTDIEPVADAQLIRKLTEVVRSVFVSPAVQRYAVDICSATRATSDLRLGASPRATLHLVRAAKAAAALDGRDHVLPDDIKALAVSVLSHRVLLSADAIVARRQPTEIITAIVERTPVPLR